MCLVIVLALTNIHYPFDFYLFPFFLETEIPHEHSGANTESDFSVLLCVPSHSLRWFVRDLLIKINLCRLSKDWPEGSFMNSLHLLLFVLCFVFVSFVLIAINMS